MTLSGERPSFTLPCHIKHGGKLIMKTFWIVTLAFCFCSCATAESGRYIGPEDVAWIQKGVTTRDEVVQRLGAPRMELPDFTAMKYQTTSTSTTTTIKEGDTRTTTTTVQVQPASRPTKAIWIHTKSEAAVVPFFASVKTEQEQFWVRYDDKGIVLDFGFVGGPGITIR
jgi:outer membrane protein assembly factor BamE (lipoprotein component of BamABCDE complex)